MSAVQTYLILCKTRLRNSNNQWEVLEHCEMSLDDVKVRAKQIYDANIKTFDDLRLILFCGEFIEIESVAKCPDCNGTKVYIGLLGFEPCKTCENK